MRPTLLAVLIVVLSNVLASGREPPEPRPPSTLAEVLARLSTDDAAEMAWGAYLAGRDGHLDAIVPMEQLLRDHVESFSREWNLAHRAALDAFIRLEASLPDALLTLHERRFPVPVLILRSREPDLHVESLRAAFERRIRGEHLGLYAIALGNLLVEQRAPGVAALLLAALPMRLEVRVFTPGAPPRFGGGAGGAFAGRGDAFARVPEGFPPYVHYGLWAAPGAQGVLLAKGPRPAYYRRTERARTGLITGLGGPTVLPRTCALEWIAKWLDAPTHALGPKSERTLFHAWTSPEDYLETVPKTRREVLAPWWKLVRRLLEAHGLTRDEVRRIDPPFTVEVEDRRTDRNPPLPTLPAAIRPAFAR